MVVGWFEEIVVRRAAPPRLHQHSIASRLDQVMVDLLILAQPIDWLAFDHDHDVVAPETGLVSERVRLHAGYDDSFAVGQPERLRDLLGDLFDGEAPLPAFELGGVGAGPIARDEHRGERLTVP